MTPLEPLPKRHYTDRNGAVLMPVVMERARFCYAPYGPQHHVRRGTLADQIERAMEKAHREVRTIRCHPMRESIDAVDLVIAQRFGGEHDTVLRDSAVIAYHERRPALVARFGATYAMLAAMVVHEGWDLGAWIIAEAADKGRDLGWFAQKTFGGLYAVNRAGADAIDEAQWAVAKQLGTFREAAQ